MNQYSVSDGLMIPLTTPYRIIHVINRLFFFQLQSHSHKFYHLIFVTSGILDITFKGSIYSVQENQAILLPPYIPHSLESQEGYCQIGIDIWDDEDSSLCELIRHTFPDGFGIRNMYIPPTKFEELSRRSRDLTTLNLLKLQSNAEDLTLSFIEQASSSANQNFRNRFLDMITRDDNLSLTLMDMCAQLAISKTHLERLMREEFGCSAMEYYNKLKFMKACFLLQNTDLTISAISEKLCFYDESHFTRFFKKHCGITPSIYRNNSRILQM